MAVEICFTRACGPRLRLEATYIRVKTMESSSRSAANKRRWPARNMRQRIQNEKTLFFLVAAAGVCGRRALAIGGSWSDAGSCLLLEMRLRRRRRLACCCRQVRGWPLNAGGVDSQQQRHKLAAASSRKQRQQQAAAAAIAWKKQNVMEKRTQKVGFTFKMEVPQIRPVNLL